MRSTLVVAAALLPDARSRVVALAALLAAAGLAGCATPDETTPDVNATGAPASTAAGAIAPGLVAARFADGPAVDETRWLNGTFKLQDAGRAPQAPPLAPPPASALVQLDVTDLLPVGVPASLEAKVDMAMTQGDVDLWFEASDEEWRTGGGCQPRGGFTERALGVVHVKDPVVLNLFYDEAEPAAEIPYAVYARVVADPTVVPGGMAVAVTVPTGATTLVVETVGAKREGCMFDLETLNLMAWAPDDAFLGHHEVDGQTTIPLPDAEGGEYVLLPSQGGRGVRIHASPGTTLRALGQEFVVSEPRTGADATTVEWTSELDRVPTLAGLLFSTPTVAKDVTVKYASPTTTFFEGTIEGGPWVTTDVPGGVGFETGFWLDSAFGVPGLEAGTYTGRVKFAQGAGPGPLWVSDLAAYWVR